MSRREVAESRTDDEIDSDEMIELHRASTPCECRSGIERGLMCNTRAFFGPKTDQLLRSKPAAQEDYVNVEFTAASSAWRLHPGAVL